MSELAVRCVDLPVREEALSGAVLAQVQGGVAWGPLIKKGMEEVAKGYVVNEACKVIKSGWNRVEDWWEECQAEADAGADAEALEAAHHEMRRQYWNKRG